MITLVKDMNERIIQTIGLVTDNSMAIMDGDTIVGIIDYKVTTDFIKIMYITILDEYRRQGIAGKVITMLKEEHAGKYMYGDSLPGALSFWERMGAEFDEDEDDDYCTPFHIVC